MRKTLFIVCVLIVLIFALVLLSEVNAQRFPLNTPIPEVVTFCTEEKAIEHIIVNREKPEVNQLIALYFQAGICGQVSGNITYTEMVKKVGEVRIYKAKMHTFLFYVATLMEHDSI